MAKLKRHPLQFFIDLIGKRVYRKPIDSCGCKMCQEGTSFVILDEVHARYVKLNQDELNIRYFDKDPNREKPGTT